MHDESPTVAAISTVTIGAVAGLVAGPPEASRAAVAPVSTVCTQEQGAVGRVDIVKALLSGAAHEDTEQGVPWLRPGYERDGDLDLLAVPAIVATAPILARSIISVRSILAIVTSAAIEVGDVVTGVSQRQVHLGDRPSIAQASGNVNWPRNRLARILVGGEKAFGSEVSPTRFHNEARPDHFAPTRPLGLELLTAVERGGDYERDLFPRADAVVAG